MYRILFFALIMLASGNAPKLMAQFVPGTIYLKFKHHEASAPLMQNYILDDSQNVSDEWRRWISKYNISQIVKPFKTPDPELQKIWRVSFNPEADAVDFCAELMKTAEFAYAEPAKYYYSFFTPNDVDARQQWYLNTIQAFQAWDVQRGVSSVKVAIVDDAIQTNHPDLQSVIWNNTDEIPGNAIDDDGNGYVDDVNGYDVADDDNNPSPPANGLWQLLGLFTHGTHCAGIAGAATDNGIGIASIGAGISLVPVKSTSNSSLIPLALDKANEGVDYAVASGAKVISMSWGGPAQDSTLTNVIQAAVNAGRILVAAAGNDGNSTLSYPAALPGVICVGSSSNNDLVSSFSQRGNMIDVMAPGDSIWSTLAGTTEYGFQSGTSMACPMVAGLCGLMLSKNPNLSPAQIEACLKNTCDNIDAQNPSLIGQMGAGRINAFNAINCVEIIANTQMDNNSMHFVAFPNPGSNRLSILADNQELQFTVYNANGMLMDTHSERNINTENWPTGLYLISCVAVSGQSFSLKWIKE